MNAPLQDTAYAKINLALHVRARRADGYHDLETLFAFAQEGDRLTAQHAPGFSLKIIGPFADDLSTDQDNLVLRAARLLAQANGIETGLAFTLEKHLPIAAGIGGGSADAAAALRLAARLWNLPASAVPAVAAQLGADVPSCVMAETCIGTGTGADLRPFDAGVSGLPLLLVNPRIPCATGPVFRAWDGQDRGALIPQDWRTSRNDLEQPAMALVPAIGDVLLALRAQSGVDIVRMSGSGATCFAIFATIEDRDLAATALKATRPDWWIMTSQFR